MTVWPLSMFSPENVNNFLHSIGWPSEKRTVSSYHCWIPHFRMLPCFLPLCISVTTHTVLFHISHSVLDLYSRCHTCEALVDLLFPKVLNSIHCHCHCLVHLNANHNPPTLQQHLKTFCMVNITNLGSSPFLLQFLRTRLLKSYQDSNQITSNPV